MRGSLITCMLLSLLVIAPTDAKADVDSTSIMDNSVSFSCIDWQPVGVCFWLKCQLYNCSVRTSVKVRHYNPDAIVQVYQTPGDVPWEEMSFVSELAGSSLTGSDQSGATPANAGQQEKSQENKKPSAKVISRHVDVIGSPGLITVEELLSSMEYFCESGVTTYMPYFTTPIDYYSWRFPYVEFLNIATWIPGMREVGERKDGENELYLSSGRFGNVYPRIGSLIQNDAYKASTVFAQRAADIVTDSSAMHLYQYLGEEQSKDGWWPPGQVEEWTSTEGKWQMIYPNAETSCHIFGEPSTRNDSDKEEGKDGYSHKRSEDGNYLFQLWRPYECCEKKGQIFLFSVGGQNDH